MPLLIPSIASEKKLTRIDSGCILSSFFWGYCLSQIAGGYVSNKFTGQRVMLTSSIIWSIITISMANIIELSSLFPKFSLAIIILARVLNGFFQGIYFPSMLSMISHNLGETERGNFYSFLIFGASVGTFATGILGNFILDYLGWTWVFQIIGFVALSWTLLLRYFSISCERQRIVNISSSSLCQIGGLTEPQIPWLRLLISPRVWACIIAQSCQMNCFFVLLSWLPTFFAENFPHRKTYLVNTLPWAMVLPFTIIAKYLIEILTIRRYHLTSIRKIVQSVSFIVQIFALSIVMQTKNFHATLAAISLIIGVMGFNAKGAAVNAYDLSPQFAGNIFGLTNTFSGAIGFLGVYLTGHILAITQSWNTVFHMLVTTNLVGLLVFSLLGSAEKII